MSKIFEEYGEEVRAQALAEGEVKGFAKGEEKGRLNAYLDLIKSGLLSIRDAAIKLSISEDELQAKLSAATV